MMKNNMTELVFILDRSGSMSGLESDTVGGWTMEMFGRYPKSGDSFEYEGITVTVEELEEKYHGMHYADFRYRKYEKGMLRPDGQPGFLTPTGRVELWSSAFANNGMDPLPYYYEPEQAMIQFRDWFDALGPVMDW